MEQKVSVPKGSRTPVTGLKILGPRPLDDRDKKHLLNNKMVELGGFEPPTSAMPLQHSPN